MSQTTVYNPETNIIESKFTGKLGLKEGTDILVKIVQAAKDHNAVLCLTDFRDAEMNMTTFEIYNLPKILTKLAVSEGISALSLKRAIVIRKGPKDFYFFEDVAFNQMHSAKLFHDVDEAKRWLLKK